VCVCVLVSVGECVFAILVWGNVLDTFFAILVWGSLCGPSSFGVGEPSVTGLSVPELPHARKHKHTYTPGNKMGD
jgi:hypothetical protein